MKRAVFFAFLVVVLFSSCRKEQFFTDAGARVGFSTDTVFFDTVFTALGSATQRLLIRNPYDESLKIDRVWLAGGQSSAFRLNIDGLAENSVSDFEIAANDSAFVFVEVTIDPSNANLPFVINDSIQVSVNGNLQSVNLVAWGQNAHYYRPTRSIQGLPSFSQLAEYKDQVFFGDEVIWTNDKPHVIYGYLMVDSTITLKIEEGTQVHLHNNSGLWIYRGARLEVRGAPDNPVVIQGDRLEASFEENPGQWDRIWINGSDQDHVIEHAIIKNGFVGLQVEPFPFSSSTPARPTGKVTLQNTVIQNMVGVGLLARNSIVQATNSIVANCGTHNLALTGGGEYFFVHCSFPNYWTDGTRKDPLLMMNNSYEDIRGNEHFFSMDQAYFGNCILYGSNEEELGFEFDQSTEYNYLFDHCIVRTEVEFEDEHINQVRQPGPVKTVDGESVNSIFADPQEFDFRLHENSEAIDRGSLVVTGKSTRDIEGNSRVSDDAPDLGAYEFVK